jgi:hypothetical protein
MNEGASLLFEAKGALTIGRLSRVHVVCSAGLVARVGGIRPSREEEEEVAAKTPIVFRIGTASRSITRQEAQVLRDWARLERTVAGVQLVGLIGAALLADTPEPLTLDRGLLHALCDALVDGEFDDHNGLAALHDLCVSDAA